MQMGSLQQRHAETAEAVEQLRQQTNAAQQALIQALQAEGNVSVCTTQSVLHIACKSLQLQARYKSIRHRVLLNTQQAFQQRNAS